MIMKKVIAILLAVLCCFSITGCGSSISKESIKQLEEETGGHVSQQRTTTCQLCKGDGVCYHCKGEPFRDGRRCNVCDGTGKCTGCDGKGKLNVVVIDGKDYTRCSSCHGSGICEACGGTGKMIMSGKMNMFDNLTSCWCHNGKCVVCDGTGWVRLYGF